MSEESLVKIHIDLPNHWAVGGESMWATALGDDLFRIENVPFHAYGLNFLDVVSATPDSEDTIPEIRRVVKASGHRTYRVIFSKETDREKQEELLDKLMQYGASYERADRTLVAVDIKPSGDYLAVYDQLDEYANDEYLGFETCEARVEGSFDDLPEGKT